VKKEKNKKQRKIAQGQCISKNTIWTSKKPYIKHMVTERKKNKIKNKKSKEK